MTSLPVVLLAFSAIAVLQTPEGASYSLLTDVVVAPNGDAYVSDAGLHRVVCVSERWGPARTIAAFERDTIARVGRLALGPDGFLFLSDPELHRVARVNVESGAVEIVAGTGKPGLDRDGRATEVPLCSPCGLAWDGELLWIADLGNRALRAVDLERGTIRTVAGGWDATHTELENGFFHAPGRFLPSDVAITKDGGVLVLDLVSEAVLRLDRESGTLEPVPGSRLDRRIAARRDFAIDGSGRVLAAEGPHGRVVRHELDGERSIVVEGLSFPAAVDVGPSGNAFVVDAHRAQLFEIGASGAALPRYRSERPPPDRFTRALVTVREEPDPAVVLSREAREAIRATGHPWWVRHRPTGIDFLLVPPGTYVRGARTVEEDVRGDARPPHEVTISKPFYAGRTELTNAQIRTHDPNHVSVISDHHDLTHWLDGVVFDEDHQPASCICWYDASEFAEHWGLRLPSEAEWEHLARAGAETVYPWGDSLAEGRGWANLAGPLVRERIVIEVESAPFDDDHFVTAPVASYRANAFGLHDVTGNVWEWCQDWYAADAYAASVKGSVDPRGPTTGERKVLRGGSWQMPFRGSAQLSFRANPRPMNHFVNSRGARLVMDP